VEGHEAVVQLLLDNGANIDVKDNNGETALHWVCGAGREAVARLLLDKGADISAKDDTWGACRGVSNPVTVGRLSKRSAIICWRSRSNHSVARWPAASEQLDHQRRLAMDVLKEALTAVANGGVQHGDSG
jgi:hypothetical protein